MSMDDATPQTDPSVLLADYDRLLTPGLLANYGSVEVTEVTACPPGGSHTSLLTIAVCEETPPGTKDDFAFIGKPIHLGGLKGWTFGLVRYRRAMVEFRSSLERLEQTGVWAGSGKALATGQLHAQRPAFVPANGLDAIALNGVLKNNFYGGCHLIELTDALKTTIASLLETPRLLRELGEILVERGGPAIDAVSDRLGNLLIQFPVECVSFGWTRTDSGVGVLVDWRPGHTPRALTVSATVESDDMVKGHAAARLTEGGVELAVGHHRRPHRAMAWDEAEGLLLANTGAQVFISQITSTVRSSAGRRRLRTSEGEETIPVEDWSESSVVGQAQAEPNGLWEGRRIYRDSAARLAADREFVTYGGKRESIAEDRARALADIRWLVERHGQNGAWLWDPYLSGEDLLQTLVRCRHHGAMLRALTAGKRPPASRPETDGGQTLMEAWIEDQRQSLDTGVMEAAGLTLEYRISHGEGSWPFHDRFLIFPERRGGALAWSLGSSVNHAGAAHHILQKVPDGQRIADDFIRLWEVLDDPAQLIWKTQP
ncbi:MAG: VPA1262 family N-terminal domain-containing protein [Phenylobacterium sp.]|nr:VPA1262 family N-terminal domain-containing protein [Phenylobacterium sp.]